MNQQTVITFNKNGHRIGASHPNARLTDADVDLVFELREAGLSLAAIAQKFDVTKGCIWKVMHGHRRAQTPEIWAVVDQRTGKKRKVAGAAPERAPKSPNADAVRELVEAMAAWR